MRSCFSSYGRTKVLTVMIKSGELNISEITRRSGLSHTSAARHLEFLTSQGYSPRSASTGSESSASTGATPSSA